MKRLTVYEILGNREDLCLYVAEIKDKPKKFGVWIGRSEGHRYKPLLSGIGPEEGWTRDETINTIKNVLDICLEIKEKEMQKHPDYKLFLDTEDVARIIKEVQEKGSCDTKDWQPKNEISDQKKET
ncbi:MAG: hypothetical protein PHH83_00960 [Patescibacteria group bacterium]|nr:hypothetical protein [Patescibacteria group bacterium]